jgi:hypothetical protein
VKPQDITYQERISDNPGRVRAARNIIGALGKIKDSASAHVVATWDLTSVEILGID